MGDVSEHVTIEVSGVAGLEAAAEAARNLSDALQKARNDAAEASAGLAAAGGGGDALAAAAAAADADATALGHLRDQAGEAAAALDAAAASGASLGAAAAGAEADAAALGHLRDSALEAAAAQEALGHASGSEGFALKQRQMAAIVEEANARLGDASREIDRIGQAAGKAGAGLGSLGREEQKAAADAGALARDIRSAGLHGSEAGIAASGGMREYAASIVDARNAVADAEASIGPMGAALAASGGDASRAASGIRDVEAAARDAAGGLSAIEGAAGAAGAGLNDAESAASGFGGSLSSLSGTLMPAAIAALVAGAAAVAPAVVSMGLGFGAFAALAAPALDKVKKGLTAVSQAQHAYDLARIKAQQDPTTANLASEARALSTLRATWASMPAPVASAVREIRQFGHAWSQAAKTSGIQKAALGDITKVLRIGKNLLPDFVTLAKAAAPAISHLLDSVGKGVKSAGFQAFIKSMASEIGPATKAVTGLGSAFGGLISRTLEQLKPISAPFIDSLSKLTKTATPAAAGGLTSLAAALMHINNALSDVGKAGQQGGFFATAHKALTDTVGAIQWIDTHAAHIDKKVFDFASHAIPRAPVRVPITFHATHGDISKIFGVKPVRVPLIPQPRHITAADVAAIFGVKPQKVSLTPQVKPVGAADLKTAGAGAKVPVSADTSKMAGQISSAAKNVKVHGVTVDLSNAKLSGLGALSSSMAQAGQAAGKALDSAIASAIAGGAGKAIAAAHGITSGVKGSLAGLGAAGQAAGSAMAAGLAAGIRAGQGAAVAAATALANAVAAAAKSAAKISSPSKVWHGIGQQMVAGLVLGLQGGKAAVQAAMAAITGHKPFTSPQIAATIKKLLADVAKAYHSGRLGDPGYPAAIKKDLALTALIRGDNKRLQELAKERQQIENKIKAADALAKSVAQSAAQGGSLGTLAGTLAAGTGGMPGTVTAVGLEQGASAQLAAIKKFQAQLIHLKKEGASKAVIRQIAQAGVQQGGQVATALLAGGKTAVSKMSQLEAQIGQAAKGLGRTAANGAYEAGSQIGKGLAAGLKAELKGITQAMQSLAKQLVKEIRKALKVHSPSLVMAEIGAMIPAGLALGIGQGQGIVVGAMRGLSGEIVGAMKGVEKAAHDITVGAMRGTHGRGHPGRITVGGMIPAHHGHGTGGMIPVRLPGYDHGPGGIVVGRREDPMIRSGHGGGGTTNVHLHTTISVGGMQLAQATQTHQLRHARRNTATGLKLSNRAI